MRPISRWAWMMSSYVAVAVRTGIDEYTKPVYGSPILYKAHISHRPRLVRTTLGEEVVSRAAIYLNTNAPIDVTAHVQLTTADAGSTEAYLLTPVLVAVERRFDQSGPHHTVLHLSSS